ncbi:MULTISPECIES: hypothetical protein [unclassified Microcoleus]|uniref:hypothetical protein n=1 Tax=unclassified Microcoleus TaxID=2642155 RepID=UPI002FD5E466
MRSHSYSDGYGEAAHARSARPYPTKHHPHRILVRLATPPILPVTLTRQQRSLGKLITWLPQHFRFLGIALYGFLQCELL